MRPSIFIAEKLDAQFAAADQKTALKIPVNGWIRSVRKATGVTLFDMAKKLGVSPAAVNKLEKSEDQGTITIRKLTEVADILDCDLVYGFAPRRPFGEVAQERIDAGPRKIRVIPRSIHFEDAPEMSIE